MGKLKQHLGQGTAGRRGSGRRGAKAKVLSLWWSGEDVVTVVGFRRGAWEQELLALGGRGASPS